MDENRRKFLKLTGLGALGLTAAKYADLFGNATPTKLAFDESDTKIRFAMVIDLKKCLAKEDCILCIDACHKTHNVPDFGNPKDEIKWIWKEEYEHAFPNKENYYLKEELKHADVPLFCNHCDNPPCTKVCPTKATWKRDEDGIVMMDWHRCIGCRYCMAACPYGSRSFNWRDPRTHIKEISDDFPTRTTGVVEKCTFCDERIAKDLMPACVEACTEKALIFGDLNNRKSNIRKLLKENFSIRRKPGLGTEPEIYYIV
jgi:molybdopterin-containing oxidoreductase family iron-sulfur binding subunit